MSKYIVTHASAISQSYLDGPTWMGQKRQSRIRMGNRKLGNVTFPMGTNRVAFFNALREIVSEISASDRDSDGRKPYLKLKTKRNDPAEKGMRTSRGKI
jgi:hypothetical protein